MIHKKSSKGFTLIELLVVISIIGVLASIVLAALTSTKVKANDAKKISTVRQVDTALKLYESNVGSAPGNYNGTLPACEDPSDPQSLAAYEQSMNQLVQAGVYPEIPRSPDGKSYCYFDYGGAFAEGATFSAFLNGNVIFGVSSPSITLQAGQNHFFRFPSANMNFEGLNLRQNPEWVSANNAASADNLVYYVPASGSYSTATFFHSNVLNYEHWYSASYEEVAAGPTEFVVIRKKNNQSMLWQIPAGAIYYGNDTAAGTKLLNDFKATYNIP